MGNHAHSPFTWVSGNSNSGPHTCSASTLLQDSVARGDVVLTSGTVSYPDCTHGSQMCSALNSAQSTLIVPLCFMLIVYVFQDPQPRVCIVKYSPILKISQAVDFLFACAYIHIQFFPSTYN